MGSGSAVTGLGGGDGVASTSLAGLLGKAGRSSSSTNKFGGSCGSFGIVIRLVR